MAPTHVGGDFSPDFVNSRRRRPGYGTSRLPLRLILNNNLPSAGCNSNRLRERTMKSESSVAMLPLLCLALFGCAGPAQEIEPQTSETRSEEHTSELQSRLHLVCRLLP